MSELENFALDASFDAAEIIGEPIIIDGNEVLAVFNEDAMTVGIEQYGDTEQVNAIAVVSKKELQSQPRYKARITRKKDGAIWFIESFDGDDGHWTLSLYRDDKVRK